MKKLIIKTATFSFALLFITACGRIEKKKEEISSKISEKAAEKIFESMSGQEIETFDTGNIDKTKVSINLNTNDSEINKLFNQANTGLITAMDDGISVTLGLDDESGGITITFSGENINKTKPVKGTSAGEDGVVLTFTVLEFNEAGMSSWRSDEAMGEIETLSDKKVVIKMNGNLYVGTTEENPIPFDGKVTVDYPIFQVMGGKKADFEY